MFLLVWQLLICWNVFFLLKSHPGNGVLRLIPGYGTDGRRISKYRVMILHLLKLYHIRIDINYIICGSHLTLSSRRSLSYRTSPLACRTNQWNGFYKIGCSIIKELTNFENSRSLDSLDYGTAITTD